MSFYIVNASFEIDKPNEAVLEAKTQKDYEKSQNAKGLVSFEVWKREHSETVEYVLVSKWESKDDFKFWISRDEHVDEHKEQRIRKEESERPKITKKLSYFESYL
ncbi:antibiotic biosynthesis monooxygenase family protein [Pontibacter silvestris]|uniref:Antibiotic biosynthesis monooxygenase family protein n=1 Tax=Pontibacter silvestris TaxID=2305183 RepID=A0ABW4X2Q8_9BACT|nr:antibiotic biosynthesis monooxygenase [Pontibacter silvestris]MCC9135050.1 antibiotic biosynthesis monooxygenase [Pontibacter silvestris]